MPGITYNTTKTHRSDVAAEHGVDVEVESRRAVVVAVAVVDDVKVGGEGRVAVHQPLVQEVLQLPHGLQQSNYQFDKLICHLSVEIISINMSRTSGFLTGSLPRMVQDLLWRVVMTSPADWHVQSRA